MWSSVKALIFFSIMDMRLELKVELNVTINYSHSESTLESKWRKKQFSCNTWPWSSYTQPAFQQTVYQRWFANIWIANYASLNLPKNERIFMEENKKLLSRQNFSWSFILIQPRTSKHQHPNSPWEREREGGNEQISTWPILLQMPRVSLFPYLGCYDKMWSQSFFVNFDTIDNATTSTNIEK